MTSSQKATGFFQLMSFQKMIASLKYTRLNQIVLVCAACLSLPVLARANNAGGFTTLVTTAVTTGTETFNGHTDHYLDKYGQIIVQSTNTPGKTYLSAKADGLEAAGLALQSQAVKSRTALP
jgi:hypothetical protein